MIRSGRIVSLGSPEDVANEYSLENLTSLTGDDKEVRVEPAIKNLKVELLSPKQIHQNESVKVRISYEATKKIITKAIINLYDLDRNAPVLGSVSHPVSSNKVQLTFSTKISELNDTNFMLRATIRSKDDEIL